MPRELLDQELRALFGDLLAMGEMVDKAIYGASQALESKDKQVAQEVIEKDTAINKARWRLEEECYRLLATSNPWRRTSAPLGV